MLNINKVYTSSYHPQSDGFVERVNGIILQSLAMYVSSHQIDWDVFLPAVVYAYNTSISETTGDTPFFLTYGREPVLMPDTTMLPPVNLSPSIDFHCQEGHRVWIYLPAVDVGLTKKLACLLHGSFRLAEQVTPVSFKITNIQGKLAPGTVHVSRNITLVINSH